MLKRSETDVVCNLAFVKLRNKSYVVRGYRNSRCFYLTQFKIFSLSAHTHTPPLSVLIHKRRTDSWWCWPPPHTHRETHTLDIEIICFWKAMMMTMKGETPQVVMLIHYVLYTFGRRKFACSLVSLWLLSCCFSFFLFLFDFRSRDS